MEVTTDPARFDVDVIHGYLTRSYWSPGVPRAIVEKAVRHSLGFALLAPKAQVGFARVVTDRCTFAYLMDVFVLEEWQRQGLGHWLVACVMAHPDLQGLRRFTLVTRDAHEVYRSFGFTELGHPERHMEILRPHVYRTPLAAE
jgi:GNAT superfamily N-acetyltransferase